MRPSFLFFPGWLHITVGGDRSFDNTVLLLKILDALPDQHEYMTVNRTAFIVGNIPQL